MVEDILFNDDGTFKIANGDFVFGDGANQILKDLLLSAPGHYKEFPTLGANVSQYVNSRANLQVITRNISVAMQQDVFLKPVIDLTDFPSTMVIDNLEFELNPNDV